MLMGIRPIVDIVASHPILVTSQSTASDCSNVNNVSSVILKTYRYLELHLYGRHSISSGQIEKKFRGK